MNQPELTSDRLILRPFTQDDAKQVQALAGDARVSETTLNIPHPYSLKMAQEWIGSHASTWRGKSGVTYAIINRETNRLMGTVSLADIHNSKAELGYWLGLPYWRQGYCSEAVALLIDFTQQQMEIDIITARHLASNPASGKVMCKNGMRLTGQGKELDRHGKEVIVYHYEKLISGHKTQNQIRKPNV